MATTKKRRNKVVSTIQSIWYWLWRSVCVFIAIGFTMILLVNPEYVGGIIGGFLKTILPYFLGIVVVAAVITGIVRYVRHRRKLNQTVDEVSATQFNLVDELKSTKKELKREQKHSSYLEGKNSELSSLYKREQRENEFLHKQNRRLCQEIARLQKLLDEYSSAEFVGVDNTETTYEEASAQLTATTAFEPDEETETEAETEADDYSATPDIQDIDAIFPVFSRGRSSQAE